MDKDPSNCPLPGYQVLDYIRLSEGKYHSKDNTTAENICLRERGRELPRGNGGRELGRGEKETPCTPPLQPAL